MEKIWLTIPEAAKLGPLTEFSLRRMRDLGTLPCVMVGRKTLVHYPRLLEYLSTAKSGFDVTSREN